MNTFGNRFALTSFGESHGAAIGGIIDGCPAMTILNLEAIDKALQRRREGDGLDMGNITLRQEPDQIEWLSGLQEGMTLGTPIAFIIHNRDVRDEDYEALKGLCRPGHADYTYEKRYGVHDWRGGGRASARETAIRVVAGEIARQCILQHRWCPFGVHAHVADRGLIECTIEGVPAGVGDPIFDKLNARLAYAMMSIPSAIGFEMGAGFGGTRLEGKEWRDEWNEDGSTRTNHCGGIQGGISNGMPIVFRVAFHAPTTTPGEETQCLDPYNAEQPLTVVTPTGRHDNDPTSRLPVIVEAMACITLMDN